jgi:hypothetical protein
MGYLQQLMHFVQKTHERKCSGPSVPKPTAGGEIQTKIGQK